MKFTDLRLNLSEYLILPGLINAHDHLEFSLYPVLGRRTYSNMREWAADIYQPDESPIREHRAIDRNVRLMWGALRNLLAGVTTVCHHNPWQPCFDESDFPVRVVRNYGWAHSLAFAPDIAQRYRNRPPGAPFIVHAAEGTDAEARGEIRRLDELGVLGPDTVLIHACAIGEEDIAILRERGCAIVCCPCSNINTYGSTVGRSVLDSGIPLALGSDSAITGEGDLRDDIRAAHRHGATPQQIYAMVTDAAARILRLPLAQSADVIAVHNHGQTRAEALLNLEPELVVVDGKVKLLSPELHEKLRPAGFSRLTVGGRTSWVAAPVAQLHAAAVEHLGPDIRLSGRLITL